MRIFVLTLSWNGAHLLRKLVPSFQSAMDVTHCNGFHWLVRDNASTDDTEQYMKSVVEANPNITYYKINHNRDNYARCNNFLMDTAAETLGLDFEKDYILFLNNDIIINDPMSVNYMLNLMKDDVGVVGSKLLYPSGKLQHAGVIFGKEHGGYPFHFRVGEKDDEQASLNREFQAVTFAFALVRASCIRDLPNGRLNEEYHWCFEDVSCNLDIVYKQKKRVLYCGKTNITHVESDTLRRNPINLLYQNHNFGLFRKEWMDKRVLDLPKYLSSKQYKVIK